MCCAHGGHSSIRKRPIHNKFVTILINPFIQLVSASEELLQKTAISEELVLPVVSRQDILLIEHCPQVVRHFPPPPDLIRWRCFPLT